MKASYRLSARADQDLSEIVEYGIFKFGLEQARKYLIGLELHFDAISQNQDLGRSASELAKNLKRLKYGSHVVFYQRTRTGVVIVRVLHQSRDFERHL